MSWFSRLRTMLQRDRLEADVDEELQSHIEMRARDNMAAGMTPEEACYAARRRFGNVSLLKEDTLVFVVGRGMSNMLSGYCARVLGLQPRVC